MSRAARVRRAVYFAAHRARGHRLGERYERLSRWDERRTPADVISRPLLADVLDHAAGRVPLYRELLAARRGDIRPDPVGALASLPVLTKSDLQERYGDLQSDDADARGGIVNASGGSTGRPTQFRQDADHVVWTEANRLFSFHLAGHEAGEPLTWVTGNLRDLQQGNTGLRARVGHLLLHSNALNAFSLSPTTIDAMVADLRHGPARLLVGYASSLHEIAKAIERRGTDVPPQRGVCCTSDTLYPEMRERMTRIFGCQVFNRYGCKEIGDAACECPAHDGLHVFPWQSFVEILDDAGAPLPAGQVGRLVATTLHNKSMPLLRYDTGDLASLTHDPCRCGRSWPRLVRLLGRSKDTFRRPDGTLVDGHFFNALLFERSWIEKFQVVQEALDHVTVRLVVKRSGTTDAELDEIVRHIRQGMGQTCRVDVNIVPDIPPLPSGKYRYTVSLLDS